MYHWNCFDKCLSFKQEITFYMYSISTSLKNIAQWICVLRISMCFQLMVTPEELHLDYPVSTLLPHFFLKFSLCLFLWCATSNLSFPCCRSSPPCPSTSSALFTKPFFLSPTRQSPSAEFGFCLWLGLDLWDFRARGRNRRHLKPDAPHFLPFFILCAHSHTALLFLFQTLFCCRWNFWAQINVLSKKYSLNNIGQQFFNTTTLFGSSEWFIPKVVLQEATCIKTKLNCCLLFRVALKNIDTKYQSQETANNNYQHKTEKLYLFLVLWYIYI